MKVPKIFYAKDQEQWRDWLTQYQEQEDAVWLVSYNKKANLPCISWSDAVSVALCFGWIDSKKIKVDELTTHQFFSKRKAKSTWSKINKVKVAKLIEDGLMTDAGLKTIAIAKENGSWTLLDEVEELIIPTDLAIAFDAYEGAAGYFAALSKSVKKMMLQWIVLAKQANTRQNRIEAIAKAAANGQKPKGF